MNKALLNKYYNNHCSPDEVKQVLLWLNEENNTHIKNKLLKDLWDNNQNIIDEGNIDFERILDKVHHEINIEKYKKASILNRNTLSFLSKFAAILFISLFITSIYLIVKNSNINYQPIYTEIHAPNGSRTTFDLPDGSKVWLNSGSSLKFPESFKGAYRNVELLGEAFFDVAHDTKKPLVVKSGNLHVMVHGTEFNVLNYSDTDIEVTLKSGKISLNQIDKNNNYKKLATLKPSEQAIFSKKSKKLSYSKVNPEKYIAWTQGILMFENDPLDKVVQRLEKSFNVDITIADTEITNYTFTATFVDETLNQVLKLLKLAIPINYKIEKSKKMPDGTFSNTKILIYKK